MAKKKTTLKQEGAKPRLQTAQGWVRQVRRERGKEKLRHGYDAVVVE